MAITLRHCLFCLHLLPNLLSSVPSCLLYLSHGYHMPSSHSSISIAQTRSTNHDAATTLACHACQHVDNSHARASCFLSLYAFPPARSNNNNISPLLLMGRGRAAWAGGKKTLARHFAALQKARCLLLPAPLHCTLPMLPPAAALCHTSGMYATRTHPLRHSVRPAATE